jgi:hypothetical protein
MRTLTTILAGAAVATSLAACSPGAPSGMSDAEASMAQEIETLKAQIATIQGPAAGATADVAPHADAGPGVYFVNLKDGDVVSSPFRVVFGLYGLGVAPALIEKDKTGHHHLLIDTELSAEEQGFAIPNDGQHIHFGGGQTETVVELPPGEHTLKLVFADLNHTPFKPAIESPTIKVTVK